MKTNNRLTRSEDREYHRLRRWWGWYGYYEIRSSKRDFQRMKEGRRNYFSDLCSYKFACSHPALLVLYHYCFFTLRLMNQLIWCDEPHACCQCYWCTCYKMKDKVSQRRKLDRMDYELRDELGISTQRRGNL